MNDSMSQSWRDEALMTHPMKDQLRPGEGSSVNQVVQAFLRNDQGMAREEISDAVDMALRNEAMDVLNNRRNADDVIEQWGHAIDAAHEQENEARAAECEQRRDEAIELASQEYEDGRAGLAEALTTARRSGKVLMDLETCRAVVELDHDGRLSVLTETDVPALYGVNPHYNLVEDRARLLVQPQQSSSPNPLRTAAADFSREASAPSRQRTADRQPHAQRQGEQQQTRSKQEPQRSVQRGSGPVHVRQPMNDLISRLRRGEPGDPSYRPEPEQEDQSQSGPELG